MRAPSIGLGLFLLYYCAACGGGIAPGSEKQSSSGTSGTSGSATGSGSDTDNSSTGSSSATVCTPGAYVFCRCADRSEGTKLCRNDGASFEACACEKPAPPPVCSYPPPNNPPGCPPTYSYSYGGQPCDTLNLECHYPGAGDGQSDGCFATALLACRVQPGGAQRWVAAQ